MIWLIALMAFVAGLLAAGMPTLVSVCLVSFLVKRAGEGMVACIRIFELAAIDARTLFEASRQSSRKRRSAPEGASVSCGHAPKSRDASRTIALL